MSLASAPLSRGLLDTITSGSPQQAWDAIGQSLWETFSAPISAASKQTATSEIVNRDANINELENVVSGSCWDLWQHFGDCVPRTSQSLIEFWGRVGGGKAVLILDGLSLRESPWLLGALKERGYTIHKAGYRASELPCETTPFARSLGFQQRADLENNGASKTHSLTGAATESTGLPWEDCVASVKSQEHFVYWHHWPDSRIHELAKPGEGLRKLAAEAQSRLSEDAFWEFVERLAHGRRLVITADHGFAACGNFPDLGKEQSNYMKALFKSGRTAVVPPSTEPTEPAAWMPPIDLELETEHGKHRFALGRRKWKVSGEKNRLLAHGGLSLLEVFVPFFELST
ncbi:hypothetical protein [Adhaeretor mobilis]|uniref:PglZ domain-containing protein n=1 Tax=Adhaeretor mobilis TaxID=1930276 RepID=A0A517MS32_9BACT|nr:hypothetical protein [Adhaeretor mobilis]QDS97681.1 hypothetical protein HG15A2_09450 [Adhaeretor mobilis]